MGTNTRKNLRKRVHLQISLRQARHNIASAMAIIDSVGGDRKKLPAIITYLEQFENSVSILNGDN